MSRHIKVLPWVFALGLMLFTLLGANRLLNHDDPQPGAGAAPGAAVNPPKSNSPLAGGVTVLGTVSSETAEIPVGPPALAAMLTVERVLVVEGQTVATGEPLVQFDDALVRDKLKQAQAELDAAREDIVKATIQKNLHPLQVEALQLAITTGEATLKDSEDQYITAQQLFERTLNLPNTFGKPYTEAEKAQQRSENLELRKAGTLIRELRAKIEGDRIKMKMLKMADPDSDLRAANQKVLAIAARVSEAQNAINTCVLRAKAAGVVEQIYATPGMTYGPATRTPVMWLLPTGKRVVRAEVEAEFAYKLAEKEGRKVTIYDSSNFSLVYEGTLRRISTGYLPKRSQMDSLTVNPTKVLECYIEVNDANPPGKPPLRIGQPVRVSFH